MKRLDILPSVIWLVLGLGVTATALKLKVGSLQAPGPGLLPFCLGVLLVALAVILIVSELRSASAGIAIGNLRRPAIVAGALLGYAILLPLAGFFLTTCIFVLLLLVTLDARPWATAAALAVAIGAVSHVVFVRWLAVEMPGGSWLAWIG